MKAGPLPNWPDELLEEWLHRHSGHIAEYAFIGFDKLHFAQEVWSIDQIPGKEAFSDGSFFEGFTNIEWRAKDARDKVGDENWLAEYMLQHGTWNTPVVLFDNRSGKFTQLCSPYHLLEGHCRLSFLHGLKSLNKANAQHKIWIASLPDNFA